MSADGWIRTKDELPDEDITVMLYVPAASEPVWPGYLSREYDIERWHWVEGRAIPYQVTHWKPFPEPPKN